MNGLEHNFFGVIHTKRFPFQHVTNDLEGYIIEDFFYQIVFIYERSTFLKQKINDKYINIIMR